MYELTYPASIELNTAVGVFNHTIKCIGQLILDVKNR
jgi:hypothetical protein